MCGRAKLETDVSEIKIAFRIPPEYPTPNFAPSWNVAPTDNLPIVRYDPKTGSRTLDLMRWGLVPYWAKDIKIGFSTINAMAETVDSKPVFREAFQRRRCIVPVDNFYEWKKLSPKEKQPYAIALADRSLMTLAGLWETWRSPAKETIRSFTIITTRPNELCVELHNRMPVILPPDAWVDMARMPKQQTRRIVSVAAVSFATLGIAFGWQAPSGVDRMSGSVAILEQDDFGERQGALLFLKAALDRLDTDAKQTAPDDPALRSLRAERDAVRLRMREVASPLPAESLPHELGFLKDEPHVAVGPTPVPDTATGIAIPPELKVGLASTSPATDIALSRDPDLNPVILVLSPRPATKSTADNIAKFPSAHDVWRAVQWH